MENKLRRFIARLKCYLRGGQCDGCPYYYDHHDWWGCSHGFRREH